MILTTESHHHTETKIREFKQAMNKYHQNFFYHQSGIIVASLVVSLQLITFLNLIMTPFQASWTILIVTFVIAYLVADLISGLVHMYMDNNTDYNSFAGPFIAAFHLHHKHPQYKNQHPLKIYFLESGTKWWLVIYLFSLLYCQLNLNMTFSINFFLVSVGILSSVAEVSHYWCHNTANHQIIIHALQKCRILLSKRHHKHHHLSDNLNYAFLNGMTDPLINKIAAILYDGYKNNADKHVMSYVGEQTSNRGD